jgi:hypothetical protein
MHTVCPQHPMHTLPLHACSFHSALPPYDCPPEPRNPAAPAPGAPTARQLLSSADADPSPPGPSSALLNVPGAQGRHCTPSDALGAMAAP